MFFFLGTAFVDYCTGAILVLLSMCLYSATRSECYTKVAWRLLFVVKCFTVALLVSVDTYETWNVSDDFPEVT